MSSVGAMDACSTPRQQLSPQEPTSPSAAAHATGGSLTTAGSSSASAGSSKTAGFKGLFRRRQQKSGSGRLSLDVEYAAGDAAVSSSVSSSPTVVDACPPSAPATLRLTGDFSLSASTYEASRGGTTPSPAADPADIQHYYTVSVTSGAGQVLRDVAMAGRRFVPSDASGAAATRSTKTSSSPFSARWRSSSGGKSASMAKIRRATAGAQASAAGAPAAMGGSGTSSSGQLLVRSRTESIREECTGGSTDGELAPASDASDELERRRRRRDEQLEKRQGNGSGTGGGGLRSYFRWRHKSAPDTDRLSVDDARQETSESPSPSATVSSRAEFHRQFSVPQSSSSTGKTSSGYGGSLTSTSAAKLVRTWFDSFRGGQQRSCGGSDRRSPLADPAASDSSFLRLLPTDSGVGGGTSLSKSWNAASAYYYSSSSSRPAKNKKKFKVVSVDSGSSTSGRLRRSGAVDDDASGVGIVSPPLEIGPSQFCELFRHRANSDPELDARSKTEDGVTLSRSCKVSDVETV